MPAGTTSKESFVVPKSGKYRFFSALPNEFDVMQGTVIAQ
jgi:hypothetical protein